MEPMEPMHPRDMLFWFFLTIFGWGTTVLNPHLIAGIALMVVGLLGMVGCAWPYLKDPISGKFQLKGLWRFAKVRIVLSGVLVALVVSISVGIYRYYHRPLIVNKEPQIPLAPAANTASAQGTQKANPAQPSTPPTGKVNSANVTSASKKKHYKRPQDLTDAERKQFRDVSRDILEEWDKAHGKSPGWPPPNSQEWWDWRRTQTIKRAGIDIGPLKNAGCSDNSTFVANDSGKVQMDNNVDIGGTGTVTCANGSGTVEMNGNKAIRAPAVPTQVPPQVTLQNSPGSAVSYGQQGGYTAGTINLSPPSVTYTYDGAVTKTMSGGSMLVKPLGHSDERVVKIQTEISARQEQEALSDAQALIASDPQWATPHILAGLAYVNIGDLDAARNELRKAQALVPTGYEFENTYIPHLTNLKGAIEQREPKQP
ncbi:MAG: hypothetical protein WB523_04180 [Candidatus Sulfotelmatobacter sp.]